MQELLHGAGIVCIYFIVAASMMLTLRWFIKIPDELFRKILHFILLGSYIPFAFAFDTWRFRIFPLLIQGLHRQVVARIQCAPSEEHIGWLQRGRPMCHLRLNRSRLRGIIPDTQQFVFKIEKRCRNFKTNVLS